MTTSNPKHPIHWEILVPLAVIKLAIHFSTNAFTSFGLHRDEYLYISESDHLAWGYMEVPPMLSIVGKVAKWLFGNTEFAVRFFPAFVGAISIILIGMMIRDMGGKKYAQLIGGFGFLISPVFLGSNNLFQPVSFNQFMWLLSALVMVRIVGNQSYSSTQSPGITNPNTRKSINNWYWLGIVGGLGFLTKYSIVFFFVALIGGTLLTPNRKVFLTKYPYVSLGIALLIAAPNLWWQISHDFPIVRHMEELAATQLVNVSTKDFLVPQFLNHFAATSIWLSGLFFVFTHPSVKLYRFLGWTYLLVIFILWASSGKSYYTYGAYSMLFALGGLAWEHWLGAKSWLLIPVITLINLPIIPLSIPILPVQKMQAYSLFVKDELGMESSFRWEDGVVRNLRQDYADMLGWEEIPQKVAKIYHSLSPEQQATCFIFAGHYGQAGVMNFYRAKYDLPETYSFNASFVAWANPDLEITCQIDIDDNRQGESVSFYSTVLRDSIENPYARDPGYIYF
ncbi:MAG: glycosyltransferase family 39 protein, partial [Bacteroidota bacterium]